MFSEGAHSKQHIHQNIQLTEQPTAAQLSPRLALCLQAQQMGMDSEPCPEKPQLQLCVHHRALSTLWMHPQLPAGTSLGRALAVSSSHLHRSIATRKSVSLSPRKLFCFRDKAHGCTKNEVKQKRKVLKCLHGTASRRTWRWLTCLGIRNTSPPREQTWLRLQQRKIKELP